MSAAFANPPTASVEALPVLQESLSDTAEVPGIIDFNTSSQLTSEQTGIITAIYFNEGEMVKKGQIIATLNTDLLEQDIKVKKSEINALKADQSRIKKDIERANKLLKTSFESKRSLENLEFSLKANQANHQKLLHQLQRLKLQLAKSKIKAEFDGLILARHKQPGEWLGQADPIITLAKLSDTIAKVSIPERHIRYTQLGSTTNVTIPALDMNIEGTLLGTIPVADLRTKSIPLKISIDYQPGFIRNMSVKASIATSAKREVLTFPRDALVQHKGKEFVYTVKTNSDGSQQAKITPVSITGRYGEKVAVQPGLLTPEALVITKGNDRLRPDQAISLSQ
jgi:RND family efflux transporter MFP subunit